MLSHQRITDKTTMAIAPQLVTMAKNNSKLAPLAGIETVGNNMASVGYSYSRPWNYFANLDKSAYEAGSVSPQREAQLGTQPQV
jgi:hypothetical protein